MHLFSRVFTLTGGPVRPVEWALAMMEKANDAMDVDVSLWIGAFGYPGGTVAWSTLVESRAHLTEQMGKVAAHQGFLQAAEMGQEFASGPYSDRLRTVFHTTTTPGDIPVPIGAVADELTVQAAPGQFEAVQAWAVKNADLYAALTGSPVAVLVDDYGPFGQVSSLASHVDASAADAAAEAAMGSGPYRSSLNEAATLCVRGSVSRAAMVRVG